MHPSWRRCRFIFCLSASQQLSCFWLIDQEVTWSSFASGLACAHSGRAARLYPGAGLHSPGSMFTVSPAYCLSCRQMLLIHEGHAHNCWFAEWSSEAKRQLQSQQAGAQAGMRFDVTDGVCMFVMAASSSMILLRHVVNSFCQSASVVNPR